MLIDREVSRRKKVAILTPPFLHGVSEDPSKLTCMWGGGERYLVDLVGLLQRSEVDVAVFQPSQHPWTYEPIPGFNVVGLGDRTGKLEFCLGATDKFNRKSAAYDLRIYFDFSTAVSSMSPSIGISHGIWWDREDSVDRLGSGYRRSTDFTWLNYMASSMCNTSLNVSVDTNTINWARCMFGPEIANKFHYIPNYADEEIFFFPEQKKSERVTILFARRLVHSRGAEIALDLAKEILPKYPNVDFLFAAASGQQEYETELSKLVSAYPTRVIWEKPTMFEIPEYYRRADISLVPTLHCEGTSLTCIESMASGATVLTTHVGGISDLVQSGVSGIVVNPQLNEFIPATESLIEDAELRRELSLGARMVFEKSFTKRRWEERWMAVMKNLSIIP